MKNFNKILLLFTCLMASFSSFSQDPTFSQFYANPLYLNPAFAGSNGCPRYTANYRNQWPNLSANYVSYSASYDQYFKNLSGGIGIIATHDRQGAGSIQTSNLGLIYSYHLKVNKKFSMLFGAQAAWYQRYLDWDKLTFGDQIDHRRGFIYETKDLKRGGSKGFFDASAGFVGYSKNFFFGGAVHHLNMPNSSVILGNSPMPMRFTGHLGAEIKIGKRSKYSSTTSIMPNIIYQYQQGHQEMNIGTYIKYENFTAGVWYRNKDAFILTVGINTGSFRVGYSYDVTVSPLSHNETAGSHEISLGYNVACKKTALKFRTISCPSF